MGSIFVFFCGNVRMGGGGGGRVDGGAGNSR